MNQYLLAFIETKHDTMCFNLVTPLLNLELYIVSEYRHYAKKKSTHPGKKAQKALQPIKKKQATEKKHYSAFKSTHYDPWSGSIRENDSVRINTVYYLNLTRTISDDVSKADCVGLFNPLNNAEASSFLLSVSSLVSLV